MEAGVNIWRALRNNHTTHPAWAHLQHSPLTEADLPRAITAIKPGQNPAEELSSKPAAAVAAAPVAAPAAAGGMAASDLKLGSVVRRKTTVEVVACDPDAEEFAAA